MRRLNRWSMASAVMVGGFFVAAGVALASSVPASSGAVPGGLPGVVVRRVMTPMPAGAEAFREGDVITSWRQERPGLPPTGGEIRTPMDFTIAKLEHDTLGPMRMIGERAGRPMTWEIPDTLQYVVVRFRFAPPWEERFLSASGKAKTALAESCDEMERLARDLEQAGHIAAAAWAFGDAAGYRVDLRDAAGALADSDAAARVATALPFETRAIFAYWRVMDLGGTPHGPVAARDAIGMWDGREETLLTAAILTLASQNFEREGDIAGFRELLERCLAIYRRLAPGSIRDANTSGLVGRSFAQLGDLDRAEALFQYALDNYRAHRLGPMFIADQLNNLGIVARYRGKLELSEEYLLQAVELKAAAGVRSGDLATTYSNLGSTAEERHDLEAAESYHRKALELLLADRPSPAREVKVRGNLGFLLLRKDDLDGARAQFDVALPKMAATDDTAIDRGLMAEGLGLIAMKSGDAASAETHFAQALDLVRIAQPGSYNEALMRFHLGEVALVRKDPATAKAHLRPALEVFARVAPGSLYQSFAENSLGQASLLAGDRTGARTHFLRAVEALDVQQSHLGGSDAARAGFGAEYSYLYMDLLESLLERGAKDDAFVLLERFRARAFLELLSRRDTLFGANLPPELEQQRRDIQHEQKATLERLAALPTDAPSEQVDPLRNSLADLRARQDLLDREILRAVPRFGNLIRPQPITRADAARSLDPGTLFLSYALGKTKSWLFVLDAKGKLDVHALPFGRGEMESRVRALRTRMEARAPFAADALNLARTLLGPAYRRIARAKRIVVAPDGPLHFLPFAAMPGPGGQPLGATHPIHQVISATHYADQIRSRQEAVGTAIEAFGDPAYGDGSQPLPEDPPTRSIYRKYEALPRLPGTAEEVALIDRLFPEETQAWTGAAATEERVKSLPAKLRILHIATHGSVDEGDPMLSSLAMARPASVEAGHDDGFLYAYEIFEQVHVQADLVVLSACDTGLGRALTGEGIMGLSRAFQYAGARSVLVSLWPVDDVATSRLMATFYARLKAGDTKDRALFVAQKELMSSPGMESPYYWAAFVLLGDWR